MAQRQDPVFGEGLTIARERDPSSVAGRRAEEEIHQRFQFRIAHRVAAERRVDAVDDVGVGGRVITAGIWWRLVNGWLCRVY